MGVYNANWEDEEKNRVVELSVEYQLENDRCELAAVTPVSVTFVDPQTKTAHRTIKIWTSTARRLLLNAYREKVGIQQLEGELSEAITVAS